MPSFALSMCRLHVQCACLVAMCAFASSALAAEAETLADARRLLWEGEYAAAEEVFEAIRKNDTVAGAVGIARARSATGDREGAASAIERALEVSPDSASLLAEQAWLGLEAGDYSKAAASARAAVEVRDDQLQARWILAEIDRASGRLDAAEAGYKWFVDYYNSHDAFEADDVRWIGLASAQYARWNALSDQFSFLVNELYPDILRQTPEYWPAHYESGLLFLEKYNTPEATRALNEAIKINPQAAEAHAALARLALGEFNLDAAKRSLDAAVEINPSLVEAHVLRGAYSMLSGRPAEALQSLVRAVELNPRNEEALGWLAAAYMIVDGESPEAFNPSGRFQTLVKQVKGHNPQPAEFYLHLGAALDACQRYPLSAHYYEAALEAAPRFGYAKSALGLMYMRLGDEAKAKRLLNEAFDADPFHVRVLNSLKVLEVLDEYAVLETDHFVIRFDRTKDALLAHYAAEYLEEIYPELTRRFGFEPPQKSLFEIFNRSRNTSGHGWFSARVVGLPSIGTVGACAGKIVAIASPNDIKAEFNWARVLKHEFVHVLNLQQTNFNCPHWFTEGLAVLAEEWPRPQAWSELLVRRSRAGQLFDLDTIETGFIRPTSGDDWTLAYCQAQLYAEYMLATYGDDALSKMLAAYADHQTTRDAIQRSFGVGQESFEEGYAKYVEAVIDGLKLPPSDDGRTFAELREAQAAAPDDADLAARLAYEYLQRKSYADARRLADKALATSPNQPLATYIIARLRLLIGEEEGVEEMLEAVLDRQAPQPNVLTLFAELKLRAKEYDAAAELLELGRTHYKDDLRWTKSLVRVHLAAKDDDRLAEALAELANHDDSSIAPCKKLAQLALARNDYAGAREWARRAIHIDVMDADAHRVAAEAASGLYDYVAAAESYRAVTEIDPDDHSARRSWAEMTLAAGNKHEAQKILDELLKRSPADEEAKKLREKAEE